MQKLFGAFYRKLNAKSHRIFSVAGIELERKTELKGKPSE